METKLNRRQFCKIVGAGVLSYELLAYGAARNMAEPICSQKPNIIFIFDDQLRAQALSCYGNKNITTPNLDLLASQGIRFKNATSTCPLCTPYRAMLQTGRYPTHSGAVINWVDINPNQTCIAHVLKQAGYHTGFIGKWHLWAGGARHANKYEPTPGADEFYKAKNAEPEFVPPGQNRLGYEHWQAYNFHMDFNKAWYFEDTPERLYMPGFETDGETDFAIDFMVKHRSKDSKPFFLMVAPHPPHPLWNEESTPEGYINQIPKELVYRPNVPPTHPRRRNTYEMRSYYAMIKNFDDNVGRIIRFLDNSSLGENTIIVITSDHGEQHGSQNRVNKMVPYAESVDIPLIIRWPGKIPAGIVSDSLYTPIDHMATLCGLAGISTPDTCDGMDLSKEILGKGNVDREAILMANYVSHWDFFQTQTLWPEWRGVRTKRHTYVKWLDGKEELYDNIEDPCQRCNLAVYDLTQPGPNISILNKMRAHLKRLLTEAHDEFLPGTAYGDWYDDQRRLVKTSLGPIKPTNKRYLRKQELLLVRRKV